MCLRTSDLVWQAEQVAAVGEIFVSLAGSTSIVRCAPSGTWYTLCVLIVVPSTAELSGSSNDQTPLASATWHSGQLLRSSFGKRTPLKSFTELLNPTTTYGVVRNPPAWIECTITLKSIGVSAAPMRGSSGSE